MSAYDGDGNGVFDADEVAAAPLDGSPDPIGPILNDLLTTS
jgi:hypothetical protein